MDAVDWLLGVGCYCISNVYAIPQKTSISKHERPTLRLHCKYSGNGCFVMLMVFGTTDDEADPTRRAEESSEDRGKSCQASKCRRR